MTKRAKRMGYGVKQKQIKNVQHVCLLAVQLLLKSGNKTQEIFFSETILELAVLNLAHLSVFPSVFFPVATTSNTLHCIVVIIWCPTQIEVELLVSCRTVYQWEISKKTNFEPFLICIVNTCPEGWQTFHVHFSTKNTCLRGNDCETTDVVTDFYHQRLSF